MPLSHWLPRYKAENPGRYVQTCNLVNRLLGRGKFQLTENTAQGEYIFKLRNALIPYPALSDGYRALIGWISDLLYHICETCPSGKKLVENQGIVMIDEVDLHIHPGWQMELLPRLARHLPKIQFIVTSHSPLLVGSLNWQNIIIAQHLNDNRTELERMEIGVAKMDADQILLSELYGLKSTRSGRQTKKLRDLVNKTRDGDAGAALKLMAELSGAEP